MIQVTQEKYAQQADTKKNKMGPKWMVRTEIVALDKQQKLLLQNIKRVDSDITYEDTFGYLLFVLLLLRSQLTRGTFSQFNPTYEVNITSLLQNFGLIREIHSSQIARTKDGKNIKPPDEGTVECKLKNRVFKMFQEYFSLDFFKDLQQKQIGSIERKSDTISNNQKIEKISSKLISPLIQIVAVIKQVLTPHGSTKHAHIIGMKMQIDKTSQEISNRLKNTHESQMLSEKGKQTHEKQSNPESTMQQATALEKSIHSYLDQNKLAQLCKNLNDKQINLRGVINLKKDDFDEVFNREIQTKNSFKHKIWSRYHNQKLFALQRMKYHEEQSKNSQKIQNFMQIYRNTFVNKDLQAQSIS